LPDLKISRRDFLNGVLLGTGTSLLGARAPALAGQAEDLKPDEDWYGYGGVGDYAASHGNTPELVSRAHDVRSGRFRDASDDAIDTGETYDVVIVGAGLAGLGAAYEFQRTAAPSQHCLMLDNHPVFGGEAKRNEFDVEGHRLIAPQGSNGFSVPAAGEDLGAYAKGDAYWYEKLGVPREFAYQAWQDTRKPLRFGSDNYGFLYWLEHTASMGYFFDRESHGVSPQWAVDPWNERLRSMPLPQKAIDDLLAWRYSERKPYAGEDFERWLDTMTYKDFIEKVMRLSPAVTDYADPILVSAAGGSSDVLSAYAAYAIVFPGTNTFLPAEVRDFTKFERHSFPGGNTGFARFFVKRIMPEAIGGKDSFEDIINGPINFDRLDRTGQRLRMRLGATVVDVKHTGKAGLADKVALTYVRGDKLYRVTAGGVVMATGGWITKHAVRDLPTAHHRAMSDFVHAPFLVANVALRNWRFMYELGITACRWSGGFGFSCNLRQPMLVGDHRPPLDPDKPIVLTFYVPFFYPGHPARTQGLMGRTELLGTSYADYERQIIAQLNRLFAEAGFDAKRDLAGIILNRWGHAYVLPTPGFYFGKNGAPALREVVRQPFGRIAFGHSELHGNQHWGPAADEGQRAIRQVFERS